MFTIMELSLNLGRSGHEVRDLGLNPSIELVNVNSHCLQFLVTGEPLYIGEGKLSDTCRNRGVPNAVGSSLDAQLLPYPANNLIHTGSGESFSFASSVEIHEQGTGMGPSYINPGS